jgi:hypothetical protein
MGRCEVCLQSDELCATITIGTPHLGHVGIVTCRGCLREILEFIRERTILVAVKADPDGNDQ